MAIDADDFEVALAGGVAVGFERVGIGDAEFVGFQAGGDVGMGFGIDIGVDAQGDGCGFAQAFGNLLNAVDFGDAFHIEAFHARMERELDFRLAFAHA